MGAQTLSQLKNTNRTFDNILDSVFLSAKATPTGVAGTTLTAKTQIANGASTALVANSHNLMPADGNDCTLTLPTQANSVAGDVIVLEWNVTIANGQTHKIGTGG